MPNPMRRLATHISRLQGYLHNHWPFVIVFLIATIIRVFALTQKGTLWFDEIFSVEYAIRYPLGETIKYWILETNPPLYTAIMRIYFAYIPSSVDWLVRLPALLFSLSSVVALYHLGVRFFGRAVGMMASIALSISGLHVMMSVEGRVYTLLLLLTILLSYQLLLTLESGALQRRIHTWLFLLITAILYSHLTAVLMVGIVVAMIVLSPLPKHVKRTWLTITSMASIAWLLWFVPSILSKLSLRSGSAWFLHLEENLLQLLLSPFTALGVIPFVVTMVFVTATTIVCLYLLRTRELTGSARMTHLFIAAWALLPPLFSSALGVFVPKYVMFGFPGFYLLISIFVVRFVRTWQHFLFALFLLIATMLPTLSLVLSSLSNDWRQAAITDLRAYDHTQTRVYVAFPFASSLARYYDHPVHDIYILEDDLVRAERVVRHNWSVQHVDDDTIDNWVEAQLAYDAETYVIIINSESYLKLLDAFERQGWTYDRPTVYPDLLHMNMYTLTKSYEE